MCVCVCLEKNEWVCRVQFWCLECKIAKKWKEKKWDQTRDTHTEANSQFVHQPPCAVFTFWYFIHLMFNCSCVPDASTLCGTSFYLYTILFANGIMMIVFFRYLVRSALRTVKSFVGGVVFLFLSPSLSISGLLTWKLIL